jgi:hypothetical protein
MMEPIDLYGASGIKRARATRDEMEARAQFFIDYARRHAPVTVRGLYYQAEVHSVPGIGKDENSYSKVQRQVLELRRQGRLRYEWIADASRWMRKPRTFDSWQDALKDTARLYRKSLWRDTCCNLEIWCEKDALAGVLLPVTQEYDVPLMVSRGYTSETFAYEAVEAYEGSEHPYVVYALYDFDKSGQAAAQSLKEKVERFGAEKGVKVHFHLLGLNPLQVQQYRLPTRAPKRKTTADKAWPYDFACELDALPPDTLRAITREAIEHFLPSDELERLKVIEAEERRTLNNFIYGEAA